MDESNNSSDVQKVDTPSKLEEQTPEGEAQAQPATLGHTDDSGNTPEKSPEDEANAGNVEETSDGGVAVEQTEDDKDATVDGKEKETVGESTAVGEKATASTDNDEMKPVENGAVEANKDQEDVQNPSDQPKEGEDSPENESRADSKQLIMADEGEGAETKPAADESPSGQPAEAALPVSQPASREATQNLEISSEAIDSTAKTPENGPGHAEEENQAEVAQPIQNQERKSNSAAKGQVIDGIRVYESTENYDDTVDAEIPIATPAPEEPTTASPLSVPPPPRSPGEPPSAVPEVTFAPMELTGDDANIITGNALNMVWSFGLNKSIPVLNLTTETRKMIMYVCAHSGVCYDLNTNSQKLLQGHSNSISCTCVSEDKKWLATADQGPSNSMVIVWNTSNFVPVQTIFEAGDRGVVAMSLTPDARYLVTISAGAPSPHGGIGPQMVAVWDWTTDGDTAICSAQLDPAYGQQTYVAFDPADTTQFVSNSDHQVIFYSWAGGEMEYYAPPLTDEDFNKPVGRYSQSVYLERTHRALTATSLGNIVVWDSNLAFGKAKVTKSSPDKKALKLVKVQDSGINVLMLVDKNLVLGDSSGHIRFLDFNLNLLHWYQDIGVGPVNSVSFTYHEAWLETMKDVSSYPTDTSLDGQPLVLRDFMVGATNAVVAHLNTDGTDINIILKDHDSAVWALDTHPTCDRVVIASYSGLLQLWDYTKRVTIASRSFDRGQMIQCVTFDCRGEFLAVGFTNGAVRVLDGASLLDVTSRPLRYARDAITHLCFSNDCQLLAAADAEYTTTLYERLSQNGKESKQEKEQEEEGERDEWGYVGRHKAHYKPIQDMMFGTQLDTNKPRLLTLGKDRTMVEYDLANARQDHLPLKSIDRIEQSATPLCMAWSPRLSKESFILTSNNEYKLKLYNTTTMRCRQTVLGPTFGSPVQKLKEIPVPEDESVEMPTRKYLAYANQDKVGMILMPLDGNPHNSMCLVAHPGGVANLTSSHDGKYLFTAGGTDCTVHMWLVNLDALEAQAQLGGDGMLPFYGMLEGGREGEMFKELEDYFYYAQLRSQGINTMKERKVATEISLSEVPFVMRALGFYPSEQEVQDMLDEVKFSQYVNTGKYKTSIDLENFLKLYLNHRPAFGLSMDRLKAAFTTISEDRSGKIPRGKWLSIMQSHGEHLTDFELAECLSTLLGMNAEGGTCEENSYMDALDAKHDIVETLPHTFDEVYFSESLLGLRVEEGGANTVQDVGVTAHVE